MDQGGGTKHKTASAAGMKGFLATKHPEDCCGTDGSRIGNLDLEVFSGIKSLNSSLPLLQIEVILMAYKINCISYLVVKRCSSDDV